jgi:hypothetical protein
MSTKSENPAKDLSQTTLSVFLPDLRASAFRFRFQPQKGTRKRKKRKTGWKAILTDPRKTHKQSLMKTTIDLPDELLQRAEATAAQGKTTVKDLLIRGLNHAIDSTAESEELNRGERAERLLAALQGRNTEPVGPLRREELYDRTQ